MESRPRPLVAKERDGHAVPVEQVHLQFGADAGHEVSVSWAAPARARRPRVRLGRPDGGLEVSVPAAERTYVEALTGETVHTYHALIDCLSPDTDYIYEASSRVTATSQSRPSGITHGDQYPATSAAVSCFHRRRRVAIAPSSTGFRVDVQPVAGDRGV